MMRTHHVLALFALSATIGLFTGILPAQELKAPLKVVANVPLPGPPVRFDYQSFDRTHGRLYIARAS